jgi:hypothetical protein
MPHKPSKKSPEKLWMLKLWKPGISDSLDFRDTAVWVLKAALEAAYQAGMDAARRSAA